VGKAILLCLLLALAACGQVRSPMPVGPYPAKVDAAKVEGMWLSTYGGVSVSVVATDAGQGRFTATWLEPGDKGDDHVQRAELAFRSEDAGGPARYLSIRLAPDYDSLDGAQPWMPVAFEIDPKAQFARILVPNVDRFKEAVASGALPGTLGEQSVSLGALERDHREVMFGTTPVFLPLFHHDLVYYDFKRVSEAPGRSLLYPVEGH
jgi:hypothetical protein